MIKLSILNKHHPIQPAIYISCLSFIYYLLYIGLNFYCVDDWNLRRSMNITMVKDPQVKKLHEIYGGLNVSSEITIVTAYFNIGAFAKGRSREFTPGLYRKWMTVFGRLKNPLIVFLDSADSKRIFEEIRSVFPRELTQVYLINRETLWSFSIAHDIKDIFNQPDYPKIPPNTVNENYSCVMHAKFELVNKVIRENLAKTRYIAWLDIGLYRHNTEETHMFHLDLPVGFDETKVAYSQVKPFYENLTPMEIVRSNLVWVGGAMFVGNYYTMFLYTKDYMNSVKVLIKDKIMSTDQQVIYSMYLPKFKYKPRIELQLYTTHSYDDWFYLGYIMKDHWERQNIREKLTLITMFYQLL